MKKHAWLFIVGLLVATLLILLQVLIVVREGEAAVITTFGRPERALTEAGLYAHWPWPVQRVYRFDRRVQSLDGAYEQTLTRDGKNVLVAVYAGWRIQEPVLFLERVGTPGQAERNLDGLIRNYKTAIFGQHPFANLVNPDPAEVRFAAIEQSILESVRPQAKERYGIDVVFLGIRKLGLPEAITGKVFERMRAERDELAEQYRSEGEGESIRIRAEADSRRDQIFALAEADARRLRAEGDAQAAEFYQVFERDPELAMFLRKLEVLEETLKEKATVVLSSETEPFDLLRGDSGLPSGARAPASNQP